METRIIDVEAETEGFNKTTHLAQELKGQCEAIDKCYNYAHQIFGAPPKGPSFAWEVQAYPNEDEGLRNLLGSPQFFQTMSVTLRKLQHKRRAIGGLKIVGANLNATAVDGL